MGFSREELLNRLTYIFSETVIGDSLNGDELTVYTNRDMKPGEVSIIESVVEQSGLDFKYKIENLGDVQPQ